MLAGLAASGHDHVTTAAAIPAARQISSKLVEDGGANRLTEQGHPLSLSTPTSCSAEWMRHPQGSSPLDPTNGYDLLEPR